MSTEEPPGEPVVDANTIKSTPPPEEEGDTLDESLFAETEAAPPETRSNQ